jgi:cytochrome c oxidase cbb3-type subunit 1
MHPYYIIRFLGGTLFLIGMFIMCYNLYRTVIGAKPQEAAIPAVAH